MTEHNLRRTAIGGLAVTLVLVFAAWLVGGAKIFKRSYKVEAIFADAGGIGSGDPVRVAGVEVGSVTSVQRVPQAVKVTLSINKGVQLSAASRASIRLRTLLGKKYVDLADPGAGPVMPSGSVIPISRTQPISDLDQVVTSFNGALHHTDVDALNAMIQSFDKVVAGKGDKLGSIMDSLARLSTSMADRKQDMDRLLASGDKLSAAVADRSAALGSTTEDMATALDALAARKTELTALLDGVQGLSQRLTPILDRNEGNLDGILTDLTQVGQVLDSQQSRLKLALDQLPDATYSLTKVVRQGSWINVYNVGFPMQPYVMEPVDTGDAHGQEPGQSGGLPRIWFRPPAQLPNVNAAGVSVNNSDNEPPAPEGYYQR